MKQDAKECIPDAKGRVKPKSRSKIAATLRSYYPNIYSGGLFFIKKKNYQEADKFFSLYIDLPKSPIFEKSNKFADESKMRYLLDIRMKEELERDKELQGCFQISGFSNGRFRKH